MSTIFSNMKLKSAPKCFPKSAKYEIVFSVLFIDFQKCFQREWFSESSSARECFILINLTLVKERSVLWCHIFGIKSKLPLILLNIQLTCQHNIHQSRIFNIFKTIFIALQNQKTSKIEILAISQSSINTITNIFLVTQKNDFFSSFQ